MTSAREAEMSKLNCCVRAQSSAAIIDEVRERGKMRLSKSGVIPVVDITGCLFPKLSAC